MSGGELAHHPPPGEAHGSDPPTPDAFAPQSAIGLLRTTQQHHVRLSAMADQKAGFLISGSLILLGLVVGRLGTGYSISLITAGFTALVTLTLAIVAVMPRIGRGPTHLTGTPNTLFFGVFSFMTEDEFIELHLEKLHSTREIQTEMLRDIYQMGSSLHHTKFRYLGYGFRVALAGMAASFLIALIEFAIS